VVSPAGRREAVAHCCERHQPSEHRAFQLAGRNRSVQPYPSRKTEIEGLEKALVEQARERPRFGDGRLTTTLGRRGFQVNHERVHRIHTRLGPAERRKRRKQTSQAPRRARRARPTPEAVSDCWSMDLLTDAMDGGGATRVFAAVDNHSRRCVALEFDVALPAERVTGILDQAIETHGKPRGIRTDNGPRFTSRAFDAWPHRHGIEHHFTCPGEPVENAYAESFNGRRREELLDQHCFESLRHARELGENRRRDGDHVRPRTAPGGLSPGQPIAEPSSSRTPPTPRRWPGRLKSQFCANLIRPQGTSTERLALSSHLSARPDRPRLG
jgi:putative transposase